VIGNSGGRTWSRLLLLVVAIVGLSTAVPYFAVRAGTSLLMRYDGRYASAEDTLANLVVYPHDDFKTLNPDEHDYEIVQRQILKYPSGILYLLRWREGAGRTCLANAFVEQIRDVLGGWKRRGAWGHCSAKDRTAWVTGFGEYEGFSVANGLSGEAALVKVTWRSGNVTYTRPLNGSYMSVLDRDGAHAIRVDFLGASGELMQSIKPLG